MKLPLIHIFLSLIFIQFCGCDFDEIKSVSTSGEMSIVVDENVEPLMKAEIAEFERLNKEAKILMNSVPTKNAIVDFINRDTKLIVVSRNLNEEERGIVEKNKMEITEHPLAIDGIGFIVNNDNPIKRVTSVDLKNIFSGEYKYWTDIKVQDEEQNQKAKSFFKGDLNKIKIFIQRKNSATYEYIQDSILRNLDYTNAAVMCSTSVQMLNSIRENENAIGIITMNWLSLGKQDTTDTTVSSLRISKIDESGFQEDFAEFHQGLLYNAKYPYRRTIYILSSDPGISLATGLINFLIKTDGQKIVLKNSLVPVSQPVRTIQLN
ncbi:MAG: substrate-binding domain-containing protein [Ignavibacteriae bacterium]|nr:substrate-binding domain-containing protein [Ignavibacteriota bacterium]